MKRVPKCRTCDGTGVIWSMRSWFTRDGFYSARCGYCDGTGRSAFRTDAAYEQLQARGRAYAADVKRFGKREMNRRKQEAERAAWDRMCGR